ncbi:hypothetical protein O3M35_003910 [Rhynocoris fuscipes]|uniref:Vitellogenin domain-containing protein n=1 Tax=Rhynocoris fuscipes TaxID=488301 RepID=A0AAW1CP48_9HEMI
MLSISTMINSYCKNHEDCQENHSVQTIIEKFESLFNESCKNGLDDDMAYTALKCIGNAGVLTETLLSSVNYCIKNENLPNEIRLAAIQSLRRLPCGSNDNLLISIFKNNSINEELRISSYQHIIRCPSYSILNIIRDVLENEDCNQVGSYVWSHLKTQMSSAYPSRVDIQAMLQDSHLNNKFNKDFRIFSKNYEYSFYLNNYGIGVFYEMNVIFSYKSYIPRNIVSNVTVLIFGEVVNIMEVNVYIEGLEQYVEKIFAESGTFNKDSISHILQIVRVVRNQPNPLKYLIQNLPFKKIFDHLRVSISLKIFGNELKFYRIRGHSDFVNILDNLDPITIIKRFLDGKEMTYESSTMLIDTSYVTPMSSGLPLKLNAIATTAININTMCFVNATVWSTNNALEMNGKLYPSVGLNFEGTLEVDAFFTETGIRFKGLMYTSTAIEGSFEMDTFKLMRLTFNLPLQKSNIFHVETELSLVTDEKFTNLEDLAIGRHKKELCTWKILEEVVGLKLCATSLFPDAVHILQSPILLFTGPINLALVLEKTDPTATKYIVQYETTTDMNKTSVMFEFRTPGSLTKRGMTANIELDTQSQNISLTYTSTRSQLVAEGYYRNSPLEKHVNFALDIDGKKHVDFQIGLDITPAKYGNTYYPKFLLAINDKRIVSLSGSIKWVAKKGISQCDIDIDFQTNRFETIIIGYVRISEASFATRVNLDYRFGGTGQLETVASELEIMDKSTKNLKYYIGQLQIESTAYPYINSITSLKFQKAQNHIDSHLKMVTLSKNDSNVFTRNLGLRTI